MVPQFNNNVLSSFKLFLENKLLTKGLAYTTTTSKFYDVHDKYNGYYAYAAPFQPIIADRSIPGATIMSGVYLDNTFITTGQSGLFNIDYDRGLLLFTSGIGNDRISGTYSFADYNVRLTSDPDSSLLFFNKYDLKQKVSQTITGVEPFNTTYPVIFIRDNGGGNEPFAFGGLNTTTVNVRVVVITDSAFALDATNSILRDMKETHMPLLSGAEFPYNAYGGLKSGYYNYTGLTENRVPIVAGYIAYSDVNKFLQNVKTDVKMMPNNLYVSFADVGLEFYRYPNQ